MKTVKIILILCIYFINTNVQALDDVCVNEKTYRSIDAALKHADQVVKLDLAMQDPKLTSIPKAVAKFPNLRCLDVSFNRISRIPNEILACKKLQTLNLTGNRYLIKMPIILKKLISLKTVYVKGIPEWSQTKRKEAINMLPNVKVILD